MTTNSRTIYALTSSSVSGTHETKFRMTSYFGGCV